MTAHGNATHGKAHGAIWALCFLQGIGFGGFMWAALKDKKGYLAIMLGAFYGTEHTQKRLFSNNAKAKAGDMSTSSVFLFTKK